MSAQRESTPRRPVSPPPDLAEDEVDLGRYWASVAARWWLPLLGLVLGAIVGYLVALGGGSTYRAQAVVSLGTPLAVGGGVLPSVQTNTAAVRQIVLADSTKERVARDAGLRTGQMTVSATPATGGTTAKGVPNTLFAITVKAPLPRKAALAANEFARIVVQTISDQYVNPKIATLNAQVKADEAELASLDKRLGEEQALLGSLSGAEKLAAIGIIGIAEQRRSVVTADLLSTRPLLAQAKSVERGRTLTRAVGTETITGIPPFVDRIYVVDDASSDGTAEAARALRDPQVEVIVHERNQGVGAAIVTGYQRAIEERIDVTCVMAGDNQMDPEELEALALPVARSEVDYHKANRLFTGQAWQLIPRTRYLGNAILSLLTKIASGYWHVADSQAGYTAIGLPILRLLDLDRVYKRYGFPNDLLVHLNVWNARVRDFPSRPIYGVGERSGIRLRKVVPRISWLLTKGFFWRMKEKYVIRDFHPLVFFYFLGFLMSLLGLALGITEIVLRAMGNQITAATVVLVALLLIFGSQFTLFAMWFDMESNKDLR